MGANFVSITTYSVIKNILKLGTAIITGNCSAINTMNFIANIC